MMDQQNNISTECQKNLFKKLQKITIASLSSFESGLREGRSAIVEYSAGLGKHQSHSTWNVDLFNRKKNVIRKPFYKLRP
jgi:CRISPR/Cas system CSM-associated protein Csm4 (group 5 of RAMP superfamily)